MSHQLYQRFIFTILFSGLSLFCRADEPLPLYVGLSLGNSSYDLNDNYNISGADSLTKSESNSSVGLLFGVGIFTWMDAELSYKQLAEFSYESIQRLNTFPPGVATGSADIAAFELSAVFKRKIRDRFTGYLKLGVYNANADTFGSRTADDPMDMSNSNYSESSSYSDTGGIVGFGGEVDLRENLSARLSFAKYFDLVKGETRPHSTLSHLNNVSVDFLYKF